MRQYCEVDRRRCGGGETEGMNSVMVNLPTQSVDTGSLEPFLAIGFPTKDIPNPTGPVPPAPPNQTFGELKRPVDETHEVMRRTHPFQTPNQFKRGHEALASQECL